MPIVSRSPVIRLLASAGLTTLVILGSACSSSSHGTGVVAGSLPLCYGPGLDMNLTPVLKVDVRHGTRLVTSGSFRSSTESHQYSFTLAEGTYEIATEPGGKSVSVTVKAGRTQRADLPFVACL